MKHLKFVLFAVFCFCISFGVKANTLNSIVTYVYIDDNGNGHVTEQWDYYVDEGTESYHSFGNMENRSITDYTVSMDGERYTRLSSWNVDASKEEKSYKYGINYTSDGLELCHGVEYGRHVYTVSYVINNLVWQYDDEQIMYFTFLPKNMTTPPKSYEITFYGDSGFNDIKYSSYGFNSSNSIDNGKVIFESNEEMDSSEYVVALIGFPNNTFSNLNVVKNGTYDDVVDEALKGASLNQENVLEIILILVAFILFAGGFIVTFVIIILGIIRNIDRYDETNFVIPKDVNYFRDIPFDKNIALAYFPAVKIHIASKENLMGTYLLKWFNEDKIKIINNGEKGIIVKKEDFDIDISHLIVDGTDQTETEFVQMLKEVANNNIVDPSEFEQYCKSNYSKISIWLHNAYIHSRNQLISLNYINVNQEGKKKVYVLTENLRDEAIKLKGLKSFLEDMTLMDEKKIIEVKLWNEYLIFAQMFGIADKVAKQFKEFKPQEYNNDYYYYNNVLYLSNFGFSVTSVAISAGEAASSGGSFSGGGSSSGGFSSGGGGIR